MAISSIDYDGKASDSRTTMNNARVSAVTNTLKERISTEVAKCKTSVTVEMESIPNLVSYRTSVFNSLKSYGYTYKVSPTLTIKGTPSKKESVIDKDDNPTAYNLYEAIWEKIEFALSSTNRKYTRLDIREIVKPKFNTTVSDSQWDELYMYYYNILGQRGYLPSESYDKLSDGSYVYHVDMRVGDYKDIIFDALASDGIKLIKEETKTCKLKASEVYYGVTSIDYKIYTFDIVGLTRIDTACSYISKEVNKALGQYKNSIKIADVKTIPYFEQYQVQIIDKLKRDGFTNIKVTSTITGSGSSRKTVKSLSLSFTSVHYLVISWKTTPSHSDPSKYTEADKTAVKTKEYIDANFTRLFNEVKSRVNSAANAGKSSCVYTVDDTFYKQKSWLNEAVTKIRNKGYTVTTANIVTKGKITGINMTIKW